MDDIKMNDILCAIEVDTIDKLRQAYLKELSALRARYQNRINTHVDRVRQLYACES